ncbi:hypothetical protein WJX73_002392 [Symbiochloris irregularis]|uniref:Uncharacterized protein n=1 Tax=Symbiochloris irregularis TaxID=706552 RepID=A0AAW1NLA9_9CHLO
MDDHLDKRRGQGQQAGQEPAPQNVQQAATPQNFAQTAPPQHSTQPSFQGKAGQAAMPPDAGQTSFPGGQPNANLAGTQAGRGPSAADQQHFGGTEHQHATQGAVPYPQVYQSPTEYPASADQNTAQHANPYSEAGAGSAYVPPTNAGESPSMDAGNSGVDQKKLKKEQKELEKQEKKELKQKHKEEKKELKSKHRGI